ncbi:MAG: hypothetical protein J6Z79_00685 [Clostridia bacterium]|nr:hypothetical protein [Clostridia bacterium]
MKTKRILAALLALLTLLTTACGGGGKINLGETKTEETIAAASDTAAETEDAAQGRSVLHPLKERPNYTLHEGATPEEMRQTAIRAMRDGLSVTWYPEKTTTYEYTSPNTGETIEFRLDAKKTYAGIPYSSSYTGLFHFLEYYDFETGKISVPRDDIFTTFIGNDCAGGALWGIASCVPSFEPSQVGFTRTSPNMVAVGPYTLPSKAEEPSSEKVCKMNGEQTMYESYACLKPADSVSAMGNPGIAGHYMMLLEDAHVERNPDGTINGKTSTITIQDQMRGHRTNSPLYVKEEEGETRIYSGKWGTKVSFEELWNNFYLPTTCKEFIGESPYILPSVSLDREVATVDDLAQARVTSQYLLCAFHIRLVDGSGKTAFSRSKVTDYSDMLSGVLKNYSMTSLGVSGAMLSRSSGLKGDFTLEIDCIDATGTTFEVTRLPVTLS